MQEILEKLTVISLLVEKQEEELKTIKNDYEKQSQALETLQKKYEVMILNVSKNMDDEKFYWNSKQDPVLYQKNKQLINDCIKIASGHHGRVFGGYVRNVLVPEFYGQSSPGFKDVDLWFTCIEDALKFTLTMGSKLKYHISTNKFNNADDKIVYPFDRTQLMLMDGDESIVIVDLIVSEKLPVNDLNVNQLTYSFVDGYKSFGEDNTMTLLENIKNKRVDRLKGYTKEDYFLHNMDWHHQVPRLEKLKNLGWAIY